METTKRPLISIVLILKNEAARIRETLLSARAYVDRWTVLDTGSTDGTQEIVKRTMKNMPGQLIEEPFVDFSTSRNRALELDAAVEEPAVFTLFLSGDEVLCEGRALRAYLETQRDVVTEGAYNVTIRMDDKVWPYPRVLRTGSPWKYSGLLHEQPVYFEGDGPKRTHPPDGASIPSAYIRHDVSDPEKRLVSLLTTHVPILENALNQDPKDTWALFFLGDTLEHLAAHLDDDVALTYRMQAMSYFYRRTMLRDGSGNDDDVIQHCLLCYLEVSEKTGLFTAQEIYDRFNAFCATYPDDPKAAFLRLRVKGRVTKREGMDEMIAAAIEAAGIASRAKSKPTGRIPLNTSCEWQCWLVAAQSAAYFAQADAASVAPDGEKYKDKLEKFIQAGIAAGGQEMVFRGFQGPVADVTNQIPIERGPVPEVASAR